MTEIQRENREERRAICEVEKIPESEIQSVFREYPAIFGIESREELQEGLL